MNTGKLPTGATAVVPFLTVKDIAQAVKFYETVFGFEVKNCMPGPDGKLMHAEMSHGGCMMMLGGASEACGSTALEAPNAAFSLYLYVEEVDKFFTNATANGATEKMPVTDMFWGDRMGTLVDPFNYTWTFATHVKEVSPEDMKKAMEEQMKAHAHA